MSAFGGKADIIQGVGECPLIAISGHSGDGKKPGVFPERGLRKTPLKCPGAEPVLLWQKPVVLDPDQCAEA